MTRTGKRALIPGVAAVMSAATLLSGCAVAKTTGKVAAAPFKVAGKTAEVAGKTVYYTGKGTYKTAEMAGKGVYYTGKGAYKTTEFAGRTLYHVGRTPVVITNEALDTASRVLRVTEQVMDVSGKAYTLSRDIPRSELDAYLSAVKKAKNVADVLIERSE